MLSRQTQREIMRADEERRIQRTIDEYLALHNQMIPAQKKGRPDPYHVSRGITGEPSTKNRNYSASDNCWNRGMRSSRTVGIAPDSDSTEPSVAVTRDGTTTIVPASSFRPARKVRSRRTTKVVKAAEVTYMGTQISPDERARINGTA